MRDCTFHPEREAKGHIGVDDKVVGDKVRLNLCQSCVEAYREEQEKQL